MSNNDMDLFMRRHNITSIKKQDRLSELEEMVSTLTQYQGLTLRRNEDGSYEVVKLPEDLGNYTNPIKWNKGDIVESEKWYYTIDKALPHEAIKSGYPFSFYDDEYFDFVESYK